MNKVVDEKKRLMYNIRIDRLEDIKSEIYELMEEAVGIVEENTEKDGEIYTQAIESWIPHINTCIKDENTSGTMSQTIAEMRKTYGKTEWLK